VQGKWQSVSISHVGVAWRVSSEVSPGEANTAREGDRAARRGLVADEEGIDPVADVRQVPTGRKDLCAANRRLPTGVGVGQGHVACGRQDHAILPSARGRSSGDPMRPSHPAPNVRDDREAPLMWVRDGGDHAGDSAFS